jgi:hypothetical protein
VSCGNADAGLICAVRVRFLSTPNGICVRTSTRWLTGSSATWLGWMLVAAGVEDLWL